MLFSSATKFGLPLFNSKSFRRLWSGCITLSLIFTITSNPNGDPIAGIQTAIREVNEETNLCAIKLWTVEHVNLFFEAQQNRMNFIPVFGMEVNNINVILSDEHADYMWCDKMLFDVRDGGLVPNKEEFTMANLIWKKYSGGVKRNDEGMWELIDNYLTNENRSKISAIKILRRFTECNLRDAKEAVDAREIKIERGW